MRRLTARAGGLAGVAIGVAAGAADAQSVTVTPPAVAADVPAPTNRQYDAGASLESGAWTVAFRCAAGVACTLVARPVGQPLAPSTPDAMQLAVRLEVVSGAGCAAVQLDAPVTAAGTGLATGVGGADCVVRLRFRTTDLTYRKYVGPAVPTESALYVQGVEFRAVGA